MSRYNKVIIAVFCLLSVERILALFLLPPVFFPDSGDYVTPAITLLDHGHFGDMLKRTPGYPLFLSAIYFFGRGDLGTVLIQHLLGMALIFLVFRMASGRTPKIIVGILFLLDMNLLLYEHTILSDLLFAFELTLIVYLLKTYFESQKGGYLLASGLLTGIGILTKPALKLYPFVVVALLILFFIKKKLNYKKALAAIFSFLIPCMLLWSAWSLRNHIKYGYFGLTPYLGFQLVGCVENFIDFSSPANSKIKEIYKKHLFEKKSFQRSVIRKVWKDVKEKYNYNELELNKIFLEIGKEAVFRSPLKYARRVGKELVLFFIANDSILVYFSPELVEMSMTQEIKAGRWKRGLGKFFLNFYIFHLLIMLGFLIYLAKKSREIMTTLPIFDLLVIVTIAYIAGVSCSADWGLARYRLAVQPLIILMSGYGWCIAIEQLKKAQKKYS